jgi:galactokinase
MLYTRLRETFKSVFGKEGVLYTAPGSLILLGEQADELKGYALAGAVERVTAAVVRENQTDIARIYYLDTDELDEVTSSSLPSKPWSMSLYGVMSMLKQHGFPLKGFDAVVGGLLPNQVCFSGYSALTTLGCLVLNDINQLGFSRFDMVKLALGAVVQSSGQPVSVVHPFVSLFGKADHLVRVNTHTLEYEYIPFPANDINLLMLEVPRPSTTYLAEKNHFAGLCKEAKPILMRHYPALIKLPDLTYDQMEAVSDDFPPHILAACRYAWHEYNATQKACVALMATDRGRFGEALNAMQLALLDYQPNPLEEMTFLLAAAKEANILGAKALGMGQAGCTLNLVEEKDVQSFTEGVTSSYRREFDKDLKVHRLHLVNGATKFPC